MPQAIQRRLLIVEDEPSLLASFQEYFENHGFEVSATGDRETALDCLKREEIAAVVSDIHLTSRHTADGLQIAVAAWNIGVPILLVTGQPTDDLSNDPRLARIAGLVRKPVSLATLLAHVESMLRDAESEERDVQQSDVRELLETYAPWLLSTMGKADS